MKLENMSRMISKQFLGRISLFLIFFVSSFSIHAQKWIDVNSTIIIDDTVYVKATGLPYSGLITRHADNEVLVFKARCVKGLFEGDYIKFYDNGDTLERGTYKKGKLNGYVYYYNQTNSFGAMGPNYCWLKVKYINNIRNGLCESYFENGKVWTTSEYKNDIQTGNCIVHFDKSAESFKGMLVAGEGYGQWVLYSSENIVASELTFKDEVIISCSGNCDNIILESTDFEDLLDISLGLE